MPLGDVGEKAPHPSERGVARRVVTCLKSGPGLTVEVIISLLLNFISLLGYPGLF